MNQEQALQIIEHTETDYSQHNRIMRGLEILSKHYTDMDMEIACEYDIIYAGGFNPE